MRINYFKLPLADFIIPVLLAILAASAFDLLPVELALLLGFGIIYILVSRIKLEANIIMAMFVLIIISTMINVDFGIAKGISLKNLLLYLLVLIGLNKRIYGVKYQKIEVQWLWLTFLLLQIITSFCNYLYSPYNRTPEYPLIDMKVTFDLVLLLITLGALNLNRNDISTILKWLFVFVALLSMLNTFCILAGVGLSVAGSEGGGDEGRIIGILGEANKTAVFLAIFIPMGLHLIFSEKNPIRKWFYIFCLLFPILSILLTVSRGGMIAAVFGIAIMCIREMGNIRKIILGFLLVVFLVGVIIFILPDITKRTLAIRLNPFSSFFSKIKEKQKGSTAMSAYTSGRTDLWVKTIEAIKERPLTGFGPDSVRVWMWKNYGIAHPPHNTYLSIFANYGVITGFIFVILVVKILKDAFIITKKKLFKTNLYFASLTAFAVGIFSLEFYFYSLFLLISYFMYLDISAIRLNQIVVRQST